MIPLNTCYNCKPGCNKCVYKNKMALCLDEVEIVKTETKEEDK